MYDWISLSFCKKKSLHVLNSERLSVQLNSSRGHNILKWMKLFKIYCFYISYISPSKTSMSRLWILVTYKKVRLHLLFHILTLPNEIIFPLYGIEIQSLSKKRQIHWISAFCSSTRDNFFGSISSEWLDFLLYKTGSNFKIWSLWLSASS